jgi:trehalose 6-phosphate phosphatase
MASAQMSPRDLAAPGVPPAFDPCWAYFLDVDGTLLEHRSRPQEVRVEPALRSLLDRLLQVTGGAVALISGRSVEDLEQLFAPLLFPAAGLHGNELRLANRELRRHASPNASLERIARALSAIARRHPGLLLEHKGASIALHYRLAPQLRDVAEDAALRAVAALRGDFELQAGKFVFELKPSGKNKGSAIEEFLREPPFAGRLPFFIGDDLTDEYGFALVNRIGGHSVKVGAGETAARWRLPDAHAVKEWLAEALERRQSRMPRAGE